MSSDPHDINKLQTFGFVVRTLNALQVSYLCLLEPNSKDAERGVQIGNVAETFRPMTSVPIIVNTAFDEAKANAVLPAATRISWHLECLILPTRTSSRITQRRNAQQARSDHLLRHRA
jgi:hypothetical protein